MTPIYKMNIYCYPQNTGTTILLTKIWMESMLVPPNSAEFSEIISSNKWANTITNTSSTV